MAKIKNKQIESVAAAKIVTDASKRFLTDVEKAAYASKQEALGYTPIDVAAKGAVNGVAELDGEGKINHEISASKIVGVIDISNIPHTALERCFVVADEAARYALTTATVTNGDSVKQSDTGALYIVIDDTKLNLSTGYESYVASTDWGAVLNKPDSSIEEIDSAVVKSTKVGYLNTKSVVVNSDGQTILSTGISTNGIGSYFTDSSFGVAVSVNGFDQVQGAGKDFTVSIVSNEITLTWLDKDFTLETTDEVIVTYTQLV